MSAELYVNGLEQVRAYRILQSTVATTVRRHGLAGVSEWFVLSYLASQERDVMAKDLAAFLEVEAPLVTRLISGLEERALVSIAASPSDKRIKYIRLTAAAQALVPEIRVDLEKVLAGLLRGTTQGDLHSYQKVLAAIIANR